MSDDEYTEALGTETAEAAVEPVTLHNDDGEPGEVQRRVRIPQTEATRKAMAATIAAFKADKLAHPEGEDEGDFGPTEEDEVLAPGATRVKPKAAVDVVAPVEPAAVAPPEVAPVITDPTPKIELPPAPSLDPEVTWLRKTLSDERTQLQKQITDERAQLTKDREAFEAKRDSASKAVDYEAYLESAPKSYRGWLEEMRGEKMTDDEFRQEAADFVTLMSSDVLGVKLPDDVRSRIEAQLARKAVSAYKAKDSRQKMLETNKRETEQVEAQWRQSAASVDAHFRGDEAARTTYKYLATEESPGTIVIDVIRSALTRDGTKLSWDAASKLADEYLGKQAKAYYEKRKHLLVEQQQAKAVEAPPGRPPGTQVVRAPAPKPEPLPPPVTPPPTTGKWNPEEHRRATRRAFAQVFKPQS